MWQIYKKSGILMWMSLFGGPALLPGRHRGAEDTEWHGGPVAFRGSALMPGGLGAKDAKDGGEN